MEMDIVDSVPVVILLLVHLEISRDKTKRTWSPRIQGFVLPEQLENTCADKVAMAVECIVGVSGMFVRKSQAW